MDIHLRSSVFGQLVRLVTRNRYFKYPDEIDHTLWTASLPNQPTTNPSESTGVVEGRQIETRKADQADDGGDQIVGWYGPDDPENPQNWPDGFKHLIAFQMCILNFAVYIASSIYVPGAAGLMQEFEVDETIAILGLSLFTLGYGFGPMLWSPLSEMPKLGRSGIFFWTLLAFILFQLPVGFAPNITVFLVFRWITGFCGSPCLATGGGTITDIYPPAQVPYLLCIWSSAGILGPVLGPIIGGFLAPAMGWRWTIWAFTFLCSLVLIIMFFLFPETSASNILYNRAKRFRQLTGNHRLQSQFEIDARNHTLKDNLSMLSRAFTLTFFEPIVLLMNLYAGLLYGILFIWFESFPLVFGGIYGFTLQQQGLVFLGILVFAAITVPLYLLWIRKCLAPDLTSKDFKPEMVLPPMFVGCLALPICLFVFGWTSRGEVHWIVPVIGSGLFSIGIVTLFNPLFTYLGITYAHVAASVFAGSTLFRASFGASFPLFAHSLFGQLGIGPGNSLLGGLAILFVPAPFIFYHAKYGEEIRRWSRRAAS
ncbi:major facilitator superfamily domain-containing protein [Stachybotrys elegans]|uniref:Major facilitator superfamily domain-containing protein n=1 Tax=Stachybotrys elegans TaxID=80388 RepID=A0A8K0SN55_9HYPO|nr:major facilitator superfamily domain-containing protein [Stachybotrys elegans]